MIVPADKAKVIMNVTDYENKKIEMLSDERTYVEFSSNLTAKYKNVLPS